MYTRIAEDGVESVVLTVRLSLTVSKHRPRGGHELKVPAKVAAKLVKAL